MSLCLTLAKVQTVDIKSHASSVQERTNKNRFKGVQQRSSRHYRCLSTTIASALPLLEPDVNPEDTSTVSDSQDTTVVKGTTICLSTTAAETPRSQEGTSAARHFCCQKVLPLPTALPLHPREGTSTAKRYFRYQPHFCCTQEKALPLPKGTSVAPKRLALPLQSIALCCT